MIIIVTRLFLVYYCALTKFFLIDGSIVDAFKPGHCLVERNHNPGKHRVSTGQ